MENVAIKGRGGNDVQQKNWKGKILRIWITVIRHGGLGHEHPDHFLFTVFNSRHDVHLAG